MPDILVPEVELDRPRIVAVVGELEPERMVQLVRVRREEGNNNEAPNLVTGGGPGLRTVAPSAAPLLARGDVSVRPA